MTSKFIGMLAVGLVLVSRLTAQEPTIDISHQWHQFRGPLATGEAPHADPPTEWSEEKNIKWKVELPGPGSSTPIIWDDRVYVLATVPTDEVDESIDAPDDQPERPFGIKFENRIFEFVVLCFDRNSGELIWQQTARKCVPFQGTHPDNNFASATPTTDGKRLYVPFGSQGFYCYDLDGKLLWERDFGPVVTRLSFGEGASLTIAGDRLIIVRDNEDQSTIEVLNAANGETIWKKDRDEPSAWATPVVTQVDGRQVVITNATNRVRAYDLENGEIQWEVGGQVTNVTPSPVILDDLVYCASGYRGSILQAIPLASQGELTNDDLAWAIEKDTPYIASLLLYQNKIYYTKSLNGILSVCDAKSGEILMEPQRLPGIRGMYASPVAAQDRIYLLGRDGAAVVLHSGDSFEVLAENKLDDRTDASPAMVGGQLFIRGLKYLYCIEASE